VPPAAGFLGKVAVFKAGAAVGALPASVALVALVFLGSALSFVYSFQVYQRRFMTPPKQEEVDISKASPAAARFLVGALAALVLVVGLWPEPLLLLSDSAATALSSGSSG
jgi:multicomponent Na+:H+ antiporter subunit D